MPNRVIVMRHTTLKANHSLSDIVSMPEMAMGQYNLEEGDQLVLLNAFDIMDKNPQSTLDVFSVDSDVFVLFLGHFPLLPKSTTLLRKRVTEYPSKIATKDLNPRGQRHSLDGMLSREWTTLDHLLAKVH